jgi:hypothetical protein
MKNYFCEYVTDLLEYKNLLFKIFSYQDALSDIMFLLMNKLLIIIIWQMERIMVRMRFFLPQKS